MQKGFVSFGMLAILGVICLVVAATLVFNTYLVKKTPPSPPSTATPSPHPSPTSSQVPDETANWKTYTNEIDKYTVKFPTSFTLLNLESGSKLTNNAIDIDIYPQDSGGDGPLLKTEKVKISNEEATKYTYGEKSITSSIEIHVPHKSEKYTIVIINSDRGKTPLTQEQISMADQILSTFKFSQ